MKSLSDYTQSAQTELFERIGVFFAFSKEQLKNGLIEISAKEDEIVSIGMGMFCKKENVKQVIEELDNIHTKGIKQDLEENGEENIIKRELNNYEAYYTRDIEDTIEALEDYPTISALDVFLVFKGKKTLSKVDNNFVEKKYFLVNNTYTGNIFIYDTEPTSEDLDNDEKLIGDITFTLNEENENLSLEFVNTDFIISALKKNKLKVKNISIKDTSNLNNFSLKWIENIEKYS